MIERYSRPEMKHLWSEGNKYAAWARVEPMRIRDGGNANLDRR